MRPTHNQSLQLLPREVTGQRSVKTLGSAGEIRSRLPRTDVLILDGESSFALSVVRSLAQTRQWRIHVLGGEARPKRPALQWSRHIESYRHIREGMSDEATVETIKRTVAATGAKLIVPVTEPTSLLCIRYRTELEDVARVAVLPSEESFTTAIDKGLLAGFCAEHGIPHPTTVSATECEQAELSFPVLLKPRRLSGGRGIQRIDSIAELTRHLNTCDKAQHCVQQVFEGVDVGCSVLVNEGKIVAVTVQHSLQRPGPFAVASEIKFGPCQPVLAVVERLFSVLRWSGVANVDCRYDAATGRAVVLEVNGRYWATLMGSTAAGVNFPDLLCRLSLGQTVTAPAARDGRFVRLTTACAEMLEQGPRALLNRWTNLAAMVSDPLPELHRCLRIAA